LKVSSGDISLDELQPSQLFINREKLAEVMRSFDAESMEPIPVIRLGNRTVLTDGHTHALAAFLHRLTDVPVYWDEDELDLEAYQICVGWCEQEGVRRVADLKDRLLAPAQYELMWIKRCQAMLHELEHKRGHCRCSSE